MRQDDRTDVAAELLGAAGLREGSLAIAARAVVSSAEFFEVVDLLAELAAHAMKLLDELAAEDGDRGDKSISPIPQACRGPGWRRGSERLRGFSDPQVAAGDVPDQARQLLRRGRQPDSGWALPACSEGFPRGDHACLGSASGLAGFRRGFWPGHSRRHRVGGGLAVAWGGFGRERSLGSAGSWNVRHSMLWGRRESKAVHSVPGGVVAELAHKVGRLRPIDP